MSEPLVFARPGNEAQTQRVAAELGTERAALVGPDEESRQWIEAIAARADAPWTVLRKLRPGDRDVEVSVPDIEIALAPLLAAEVTSVLRLPERA